MTFNSPYIIVKDRHFIAVKYYDDIVFKIRDSGDYLKLKEFVSNKKGVF